jgi:hypothetical protein
VAIAAPTATMLVKKKRVRLSMLMNWDCLLTVALVVLRGTSNDF